MSFDTLIIWDPETGDQEKILKHRNDDFRSVTSSPDGKIIASGGWHTSIILWNLENGEIIKSMAENFNGAF